jgi:hypothetical protein
MSAREPLSQPYANSIVYGVKDHDDDLLEEYKNSIVYEVEYHDDDLFEENDKWVPHTVRKGMRTFLL